jgi:hypothetical protein
MPVRAPDGAVERGPGRRGVTLGIDELFLGIPGFSEQLLVQLSAVTRQLARSRDGGQQATWEECL